MNPRVRPYEAQLIEYQGRPSILLRERSGLCEHAIVIPRELGMFVALCDGTRDVAALGTAFELYTGVRLSPETIEQFLAQMDSALLLDGPKALDAQARALREYRDAAFRRPICAGGVYPADAAALRKALEEYLAATPSNGKLRDGKLRGMISPHIDYRRGGPVYAATWRAAVEALQEAEVIVVFGTDHAAPDVSQPQEVIGRGEVTLTHQNYATPYGVLPTSQCVVEELARAIGPEIAFANELNHAREHSIELALVWAQHFLEDRQCEVVPVLCGSFYPFTEGLAKPDEHQPLVRLIGALREALAGKSALVVAAADLAHVGPAFGDAEPYGPLEKASLRAADEVMLRAAATGDPAAFLKPLAEEKDRRRVCGLPPIYLALELLGGARGHLIDYAQCPADDNDTSVVSICGMLFS